MKILLSLLFFSQIILSYDGSNFQQTWDTVKSDEYTDIPTEEITSSKLFDGIFSRAKETISTKEDLIAPFNKLLHANGICMKGRWVINKQTPYSGYFKKGSKSLIIVRASTTLSGVRRGEKRGFAIAVKLYPTLVQNDTKLYKTANLFAIDTLAGNRVSHFMKSEMTNFPDLGFTLNIPLAAIVVKAFSLADKFPMIRQAYQVSELGESNKTKKIITPKYYKFLGDDSSKLSDKVDFRDEIIDSLKMNKKLKLNIYVSQTKDEKTYKKIGFVELDKAVASYSCDHRLHFNHPEFRFDLNYK